VSFIYVKVGGNESICNGRGASPYYSLRWARKKKKKKKKNLMKQLAEMHSSNQRLSWHVIQGQESSPFEIKWREFILWFRLNVIDLTVYRLHVIKILNNVAVYTLLDSGNKILTMK
jgi:hypothetical protein